MINERTTCPSCGSGSLIEQAVHDGFAWNQELKCEDCRHVLESISYLSQEPQVSEV
jgi:predicted  nucleic acid-binding Zn ribbon protein